VNNKQYIGSAKDLYLRLLEHLSNQKSNNALQSAIEKHGLDKFNFCIYEYFNYDSKIISSKAFTELETTYIEKFNFDTLYNFMRTAISLTGYKHTRDAKLKMSKRFKDKYNHPMFGKRHSKQLLKLISKPSKLNPMFGKKHSELTKEKISDKMSKHPNGVGIYDLNNNLLFKFKNNTELAKHLSIFKVTVGKYLNSSLIYNKIYLFKLYKV
jgi:group I intron endonuclease